MQPLNFTANYLKTVYLPHKTSNDNYKSSEANIVELDPKDKNDLMALAKTAHEWEKVRSGFAHNIFNEALKVKLYPDVVSERYLALTTQECDYANLDSEKILGLALFTEKSGTENEVSWLQAHPKTNYESTSPKREYTKIGEKLIDYIKTLSDKPIEVQADDDAIVFYEKQGFEHTDPKHQSKMIWY